MLFRSTQAELKKEKEVLRPQPTASSRPRSRGLHPVGALSVPKLVKIPLDCTQRVYNLEVQDNERLREGKHSGSISQKNSRELTYLDISAKSRTGVISSLTAFVHRLHPLHHYAILTNSLRSGVRLAFWNMMSGKEGDGRSRRSGLEIRGMKSNG